MITFFFDEQFNQMVITKDNEICVISIEGDAGFLWRKDYIYYLSYNFVSMDLNVSSTKSEYLDIPFPETMLISNRNFVEGNMKIKCDFEQLKQYYENFTNVEIGNNTIEIMLEKYKCIITVSGEDAHFKIVEI